MTWHATYAPRPLRALGPKTIRFYKSILNRTFGPGPADWVERVPHGLGQLGLGLPTEIPAVVETYSEGTRAQLRAAIRRIYEVAGKMEEGFALAIRISRAPTMRKAPIDLSEQVLGAFEKAALGASLRDGALVLVQLGLGLRADELLTLPRDAVETAVHGAHLLRIVGKGNKERKLPADDVVDLLKTLLGVPAAQPRQIAERAAVRQPWRQLGEVLAGPHASNKTRYNLYGRLVKKLAKKAGLGAEFSSHMLRHGFATRLHRAGAPGEVIQDAMGHASYLTTRRYIHVSRDDLRKWIARQAGTRAPE